MTPDDMYTIALARAGEHSPTTAQKTTARGYFNLVKSEVENMATWRFLYKTSTITTVADQRSYSLASDVAYPLHFWDTTNNRSITVRNPEDIIDMDPDEDNTGEATVVSITGMDSSGLWTVDLYPSPDTSSETVTYRYLAFLADITLSADETDLAPSYPRWLQNALLWGICALYKEEKSERSSAADWEKYSVAIKTGLRVNGMVDVAPEMRMGRSDEGSAFQIVADITADS